MYDSLSSLKSQAAMTRFLEPFQPERCAPRTVGQAKACAHVRDVFGKGATSLRALSEGGGWQDVCIVKLGGFVGPSVELICAGGLLVGIPPKRPWEK